MKKISVKSKETHEIEGAIAPEKDMDAEYETEYTFGELTKAQEEELKESMSSLVSRTLLQQKCLWLMKGECGGGFYVRYLQDATTKIGWLQLVIEYPDGTFKEILMYKNRFQETTFDSDGVWKEEKPKITSKSKSIQEWSNIKATEDFSALVKYESPDMPIPGRALWTLIHDNYKKIPVVTINQASTPEQVYGELIKQAMECATVAGHEFMNEKDRCYIPKELFDRVARENNFKPNMLKNTFDLIGLFIKDKGTKGYQYSKRLRDGKVYKFYVLRKNIATVPAEDHKATECECLDFKTDVKSQADRERERYDALAKRVRDTIQHEKEPSQALLQLISI